MWELVKNNDPGGFCVAINRPRILTIGRFGCDIVVLHPSISRNHATLEVSGSESSLKFQLKDHSSFGTRVNDALVNNGQLSLQVGDRITFGSHVQAEFLLKRSTLSVAVSSMDKFDKQKVKSVVNSLFGKMTNVCDNNCSLLVMPCLVVTAKVVSALLASIPIVTPAYLDEFLMATSKIPFCRPSLESFLPPLKEERLSPEDLPCFLPNEKRSFLFSKTVFYILNSKQYDTLSSIIQLGHGEVVLCDSESAFLLHYKNRFRTHVDGIIQTQTALERTFTLKGSCVIHAQQLTDEARVWQNLVYSTLRTVRRRPILESEIGFAVVYNSTDGYCNPEKRCPQKLYEEAGISQANSVNPFHLESQSSERVLLEHRDILPASTLKHIASSKRSWFNSADLTEKQPEAKRQRCITRILPPTAKSPPLRHSCLAADSEAPLSSPKPFLLSTAIGTSSHDSPRLPELPKFDSMKQKQSDNPVSTVSAGDLLSYGVSVNNVSQPSAEEDALSVLNKMPSLVIPTSVRQLRSKSPTVSLHSTQQIGTEQATMLNDASPMILPVLDSSYQDGLAGRFHHDAIPTTTGHAMDDDFDPSPSLMLLSNDWLTKRARDVVAGVAMQSSEIHVNVLPEVHPPIEYMDLLNRRPLHLLETDCRNQNPNYKRFRKVWPVRSKRELACAFPIQLTAFQPGSECNTEEATNEQSDDADAIDREREFVNKLFEQMCEMPRACL